MAILAVIPSDPMSAYEAVGCHVWSERYYNPKKYFEKVYLLSPLEKEEKFQYGMHTIPTKPEELAGRIRDLGVDMVRAYGGYWACDMACRNKVAGVPVIVSVHDTNPEELYPAVKKADYTFNMSQAVRDLVLTRFGHSERAWILSNRYDNDVMRPLPDEDFSDLDAKFPAKYRMFCVGRLSPQKNQDNLIPAMAKLGPDYGCLFVGRNDVEPMKALAREYGVEDQCWFVESIRNDELARYYNWADAMVTPSRWEGFGIVFIEALACGAMVVTSNVRPMSEYIRHGENGLLVDDYENAEALAEMTRQACTDMALRGRVKSAAPLSVTRFERRVVDDLEVDYYRQVLAERPFYAKREKRMRKCVKRAQKWVRHNSVRGQGVRLSSRDDHAYPEVSGYWIPTLLGLGKTVLAEQYARWLVRVQNAEGSWNGPSAEGEPYTFDTGQILKGLLAIRGRLPEVDGALERGAEWLFSRIEPSGRVTTPADDALEMANGKRVPDAFHLYTLEPLAEAANIFDKPQWAIGVQKALAYYKSDSALTDFKTLSHFHAYILEALFDLGERELAEEGMAAIEALQREDGSVPGWADAEWTCSTGLAQYGVVWMKLGRSAPARRAFAWLCANQNKSGGFFGGYGEGADYFPDAEISWANKYFLDLHLLLANDKA